MDPFTATAAITSVVGGILGWRGAREAEKAAERQAREEARVEGAVTRERLRQIQRQETMMRGETIATAAASGVKVGSQSVLEVLADQAAEFRREQEITATVGASRARSVLQRAETLSDTYKFQGYASLFSGVSELATIGRQEKWWGDD